ncbi:hypothetical protein BD413DRAFT_111123 [Trametes elegans]|nr:hypothetical protein BD413DRAFT_111123 [Trametes elegans]
MIGALAQRLCAPLSRLIPCNCRSCFLALFIALNIGLLLSHASCARGVVLCSSPRMRRAGQAWRKLSTTCHCIACIWHVDSCITHWMGSRRAWPTVVVLELRSCTMLSMSSPIQI